jgi:hypothetical protein
VAEKTKARRTAERIDAENRFGAPSSPEESEELIKTFGGKVGPALSGVAKVTRDVARMPKALMARPARSDEEMDELAREVSRGTKKAKGGSVSSASKRADGIAMRGKTRGKMV